MCAAFTARVAARAAGARAPAGNSLPGYAGHRIGCGHGPNGGTMVFLHGLLDRLLVVCAVVAGGLVPGFIAQYRQRLGGRLDQARLDLEPWQRLADQFHHGDIRTLIQYHLDSGDAKFHAEGAVIRSLVDTVHQLQSAALAFAVVTWLVFQGAWRLAALAGQGLAGRASASPDEPIPQPRRLSPGDGRPRNGSQWRR
ncbi:MAG: DUF2937 family protein [Gammaproteobacteria bacterium]|nr:MAG: DUF2937 family protein [Gammaproteobacteria bacterium]